MEIIYRLQKNNGYILSKEIKYSSFENLLRYLKSQRISFEGVKIIGFQKKEIKKLEETLGRAK